MSIGIITNCGFTLIDNATAAAKFNISESKLSALCQTAMSPIFMRLPDGTLLWYLEDLEREIDHIRYEIERNRLPDIPKKEHGRCLLTTLVSEIAAMVPDLAYLSAEQKARYAYTAKFCINSFKATESGKHARVDYSGLRLLIRWLGSLCDDRAGNWMMPIYVMDFLEFMRAHLYDGNLNHWKSLNGAFTDNAPYCRPATSKQLSFKSLKDIKNILDTHLEAGIETSFTEVVREFIHTQDPDNSEFDFQLSSTEKSQMTSALRGLRLVVQPPTGKSFVTPDGELIKDALVMELCRIPLSSNNGRKHVRVVPVEDIEPTMLEVEFGSHAFTVPIGWVTHYLLPNGNEDIPMFCKPWARPNDDLVQWLFKQRQEYKAGRLAPDRQRMLESLTAKNGLKWQW